MSRREYDVTECNPECGACRVEEISTWRGWVLMKFALDLIQPTTRILLNLTGRPNGWYCPACGTRIGIDKRGPWRERMVPESALEWVIGFVQTCPPEGPYPDDCPAETGEMGTERCAECWIDAALKAAEEANKPCTQRS